MKLEYYKKGKRGVVSIGKYKGKKAAVKEQNPRSEAIGRIENEVTFLKKLNKKNIGPQFYFFEEGKLGMEFIEGEIFQDYISKTKDKKKIMKVVEELFEQLYIMDKMKVNKEEMHHPVKHIIVRKEVPYLIDFERCHFTTKPKNVSQFVQYITGKKISDLLLEKKIHVKIKELREEIKNYKKDNSRKNLNKLISLVNA